jgi:hypothetical protein
VSDNHSYDEPLPWLEPVDDEDEPRGISARRMLAVLAVVLLAVLIVAATFFVLGRHEAAGNGPPELIHAPAGPYKVKPPNPGGLDISGESETAFETSAGADPDAKLDLNKLPEEPMAKPDVTSAKPAAAGETKPAQAPAVKPEPAPSGGSGSVIQLGAFANQAQAERAWSALSARFATIRAMSKMIVPYSGGIRLRAGAASPAEAKQACQTLKAAGENCFVAH